MTTTTTTTATTLIPTTTGYLCRVGVDLYEVRRIMDRGETAGWAVDRLAPEGTYRGHVGHFSYLRDAREFLALLA